jgi:hypothetical protein
MLMCYNLYHRHDRKHKLASFCLHGCLWLMQELFYIRTSLSQAPVISEFCVAHKPEPYCASQCISSSTNKQGHGRGILLAPFDSSWKRLGGLQKFPSLCWLQLVPSYAKDYLAQFYSLSLCQRHDVTTRMGLKVIDRQLTSRRQREAGGEGECFVTVKAGRN